MGRNFRWQGGEIDLIVHRDLKVAFVEVKGSMCRKGIYLPRLLNTRKVEKIRTTASIWLKAHHGYQDCDMAMVGAVVNQIDGRKVVNFIPLEV